jgi:bifunctional non-homologous end joining protein LigD
VVVPLARERDWSECLAFARDLAEAIARQHPRSYTTRFAKQGREKQILIDYLRNNRTNTSVAAFSPRARRGAPVSTPLDWSELSPRLDPAKFTLKTIARRLRSLRADPWKEMWTLRQPLSSAAQRAVRAI